MCFKRLIDNQRNFFRTGATLPVSFRINQLVRLKKLLKENETVLIDALKSDLGKSAFEAYTTEIGMVYQEINTALRNVEKWANPRRVPLPIFHFPASGYIIPEPYGTVLIISPWNYPVQLSLNPLVSAIAAGNCVILKPSANSARVSQVLADLISRLYPRKYIAVVQGGREENAALIEQRFDKIFFTGSTAVGRVVMEAASRHLTPVTLELGGKSPVIVDRTANLGVAARRILWGKTINSGQTCVAPDYVLVDYRIKSELLKAMKIELKRLWGVSPLSNREYPRIINKKHFDRLIELMRNENIFLGGGYDSSTLRIEPTVLDEVDFDSPVMQQEIFGPILPVLAYKSLDEAIFRIVTRPKPLALYLFTRDKSVKNRVLGEISFGGGCINDTLMHLASSKLPFGGVGSSGMGRYHGKYGFCTFSHEKSVVNKGFFPDISIRYPPYSGKLRLVKQLLK
jgi:aldehyde dehydrogenase (NAD+)